MTHDQFLAVMQQRVASGAVTPSAARKMGPKGTVRAARKFLGHEVALHDVGDSVSRYPELLDALTFRLLRALPQNAQHWGAARKFLNIFMRDAAYNFYLRGAFGLDRIEGHLEVPLDSHAATEIASRIKELTRGAHRVPRWTTVIALDPSTSRQYQDAAKFVARVEEMDPVHLDVVAWRKKSEYL
jgi:hypothetical protein